jgi:hypothetical protein
MVVLTVLAESLMLETPGATLIGCEQHLMLGQRRMPDDFKINS